MRKQTACALQRKGSPRQLARVRQQWGSNPQPSTMLMINKLNNKKNELWKMKLFK